MAGTPQGLIDFWMGHRAKGMSGIYDKIRRDVKMRKERQTKLALASSFRLKSPKTENVVVRELAASA